MKLSFFGIGAQNAYKLGSNSAYVIENGKLYLIDSGISVAPKIAETDFYNKKNISEIFAMFTHTHDDHIGSIGSLVNDAQYRNTPPIPVNICFGKNTKYNQDIINILKAFHVYNKVNIMDISELDNQQSVFNSARYVPTTHDADMPCYGIQFTTKNGVVYHSGDTNNLKQIIEIAKDKNTYSVYADAGRMKESSLHLSIPELNEEIEQLDEKIKESVKSKFHIMHFKDKKSIKQATERGFKTVSVEKF